jgi:hypothetical protein
MELPALVVLNLPPNPGHMLVSVPKVLPLPATLAAPPVTVRPVGRLQYPVMNTALGRRP